PLLLLRSIFFFFPTPAPPHLSTLSLHDALPIFLAAEPVPDAVSVLKVQALQKRAAELNTIAKPLNIAVNFKYDGPNAQGVLQRPDRKSTRLNSSHLGISYAVFCLKKKKKKR